MKRTTLAMLAAPVFAAATVLAACSGGGTGATHSAVPAGAAPTSTPLQTTSSGAHLVLTIRRSKSTHKHASASAKRSGAAAKRSPKYISTSASGVQIAVSTTGGTPTTQTIYADISESSTLCTTATASLGDTYTATCTIPIPTLAASESITATEVDTTPTGENPSTSLGTGFSNSSNILAVGTTTFAAATGTTTNVSLGLSPVVAYWDDCGVQATNGSNVAESDTGTAARIIVSAGTPATFNMQPEFEDIDGAWEDFDTTPLPFVDVNGSPTPITVNVNSTHVGVQPLYNAGFSNGSLPTPTTYAQSTTIPNDGYEWFNCVFNVAGEYDGQTTAPTTIVFDQDLSAIPQFTAGSAGDASYENAPGGGPFTYTVVPLSASPAAVAVGLGQSSTVTGSDFDANPNNAMMATTCSGTGAASIVAGSYDTGSGTQPFTVTGSTPGTCTFTLYDADAGQNGPQTSAITVTITSPP